MTPAVAPLMKSPFIGRATHERSPGSCLVLGLAAGRGREGPGGVRPGEAEAPGPAPLGPPGEAGLGTLLPQPTLGNEPHFIFK